MTAAGARRSAVDAQAFGEPRGPGVPGVRETVRMDDIKRHYYTTHPHVNPTRIVPIGPLLDYDEPHGREGLSKQ